MTTVTLQEIAQFRSQLAENPQAMEALDLLEDCDGDLEDAVMSLAIRAGQQPEQTNSEWLAGLAKKWRSVVCEQEYREEILNGSIQKIVEHLQTIPSFPQSLAAPVLIYIVKQGINDFCEPLDLLK